MRRTHQKGTRLEDVGDAWRIRYRLRTAGDGKVAESRPTEYFYKRDYEGSKKLAQKAAEEFMARVNAGNMRAPEPPPPIFGEIADKWEALILPQVAKQSSRLAFKSRLKHVRDGFGAMPVAAITAEVIQEWVAKQIAAPEQIRCIRSLMRMVWRYAQIWGYAEKTHNPFEGVRLPKVPKDRSYCFSRQEAHDIIAAASGWRQLFYWVLAETGMRGGECAGLERSGFVGRRLLIRQTVWRNQMQEPKTPDSLRNPHITEALAAAIEAHIRASPYQLIFCSRNGRPVSLRKLRADLARITKKLGIDPQGKRSGLHSFRHFNATAMQQADVPMKVRQQRLGHADPKMTLHYTQVDDARGAAAAEAIGALLNPKTEGEIIQ